MSQMLALAYGEMGQREIEGPRSNPRIIEYYRAANLAWAKDDSTTHWCGCFIAFLAAAWGYALPQEPARARAWLEWGQECLPQQGCVVVLKRGKNPAEGHVGMLVRIDEVNRVVHLLGGNQGNAVSVASFPLDDVLGYRWPLEESRGGAVRKAVKEQSSNFRLADVWAKVTAFFGIGGGSAALASKQSGVKVDLFEGLLTFASDNAAVIVVITSVVAYLIFEVVKDKIKDEYREGTFAPTPPPSATPTPAI